MAVIKELAQMADAMPEQHEIDGFWINKDLSQTPHFVDGADTLCKLWSTRSLKNWVSEQRIAKKNMAFGNPTAGKNFICRHSTSVLACAD